MGTVPGALGHYLALGEWGGNMLPFSLGVPYGLWRWCVFMVGVTKLGSFASVVCLHQGLVFGGGGAPANPPPPQKLFQQ